MTDRFPPDLPEALKLGGWYWVGCNDPFAPQLEVKEGPPAEVVRSAYRSQSLVTLHFYCRSADMDEEELDDVGTASFLVTHIEDGLDECEDDAEPICFAVATEDKVRLLEDSVIWVWEYISGSGGADFGVRQ